MTTLHDDVVQHVDGGWCCVHVAHPRHCEPSHNIVWRHAIVVVPHNDVGLGLGESVRGVNVIAHHDGMHTHVGVGSATMT